MNISANSLFHFMKEFDYLLDAIKGNFSPRYCKEVIKPFFDEPIYIAMKCFCDIPLSMVNNHCVYYGTYGLGLSKEWGINSGVNPVSYYCQNSEHINNIKSAIDSVNDINIYQFNRFGKEFDALANAILMSRQSVLNYKPIKGNMMREGKLFEDVHFYDEREWRYISKYGPCDDGDLFIPQYISNSDSMCENLGIYNEKLREIEKINFSHSDINFIIVNTDEEITKLFGVIDNMGISNLEKCVFKTKIFKYEDLRVNV